MKSKSYVCWNIEKKIQIVFIVSFESNRKGVVQYMTKKLQGVTAVWNVKKGFCMFIQSSIIIYLYTMNRKNQQQKVYGNIVCTK